MTPLILVPGLLCDERLWRHQAEGLAGRVTVPDVTGGDSVASMARGILEAAPERFALAGLSMGGYVSLEVVRQAPGRVEALALLDTSARPDTPEQTKARLAFVGLARAGRFDEVWQGLLPKVVHPDRVEEPGIRSAVREMAHAVGPEGFERRERAIIGRPDSRPDLPSISCPTLVMCGRDDALTPPHLHEELAEGIPGAHLTVEFRETGSGGTEMNFREEYVGEEYTPDPDAEAAWNAAFDGLEELLGAPAKEA